MNKKKLAPVKPEGMEIVFYYPCPYCGRKVPLAAPLQPCMTKCDSCRRQFPVAPADAKGIKFIKLILDQGRAAIDPDFI